MIVCAYLDTFLFLMFLAWELFFSKMASYNWIENLLWLFWRGKKYCVKFDPGLSDLDTTEDPVPEESLGMSWHQEEVLAQAGVKDGQWHFIGQITDNESATDINQPRP